MLTTNITRVIEQVSRDKGIDRNVLIDAIEEALRSAARKKYGNKADLEIKFNEELGELEVFRFVEVVENVTDPDSEIDLENGRKLDSDCEIGDSLGSKINTMTFGRIAAQTAKQVIIQKMKDAEKDAIYNQFKERKNEIINGIVQRFNRGELIINLGSAEGVLPRAEQVPGETYHRGDRIRASIINVLQHSRGPQVILSRTHSNFLVNLIKTEVPEITEGIVNIMSTAREPGVRSKIAVSSQDSDIDPVGACVGMKGSRVQNVVQELRGEKIDIVPWHVDAAKFVCHALSPAEISRVIIDENNNSMEVVVPDESLSIAIGRNGQNIRLASKLTGWRLDIVGETKYNDNMKNGYDSLLQLPDISSSLADALYEQGFYSLQELGNASIEDLIKIRDISEDKAQLLIDGARSVEKSNSKADVAKSEDALLYRDKDSDIFQDAEECNDASDDETGGNTSTEQNKIDDELNTNAVKD